LLRTIKNVAWNQSFYFTIFSYVKNAGKLPVGVCSKQALNYYVKALKIDGVISKLGYGVWRADDVAWEKFKVKKLLQGTKPCLENNFTSKQIRGHGFQFTLRIPHFDNWSKGRRSALERAGISFRPIRDGFDGERFVFRGHKTWLTSKSVVVYCPPDKQYFAESAEESRKYALYDMLQIVKGLENLLGVSFGRGGKLWFKFTKQHYADVNNVLAKQYNREGKVLRVADWDGEWLIIDYSLGIAELETTHSETAVRDMDGVMKPFLNQLRDTKLMPNDVLSMIAGVTKNQEFFAENMRSHVEAVRALSLGVSELRGVVSDLGHKSFRMPVFDGSGGVLELIKIRAVDYAGLLGCGSLVQSLSPGDYDLFVLWLSQNQEKFFRG